MARLRRLPGGQAAWTTGVVALIVALVVVAVWYVVLWAPRARAISRGRAAVLAADAQHGELLAEVAQLRAEAARMDATKRQLATLSHAVPASPRLADFIDEVDAAARAAKVTFLTVSPSKPTALTSATGAPVTVGGRDEESIAVTIDGTGTFFDVLDFLRHLAAMPRILVVSSIGLGPSGQAATGTAGVARVASGAGSADPDLHLSLTGEVYLVAAGSAGATAGGA